MFSITMIDFAFIKLLANNRINIISVFKLYIYSKTKQTDKLKNHQQKLKELEVLNLMNEEILTLIDLIHIAATKQKSGFKTFGKRLKPIKENTFNRFGRIVSLLTIDYENYLKEQGKYLDLLDM